MISFTLSFSLSLSLHNYSLISFQILSVVRLLCISKMVAYFNRNSGPLSIPLTPSLLTILKYLKDHLLIVIMAATLSVRLLLINCTSFIEGFRNLYKIILIVMTAVTFRNVFTMEERATCITLYLIKIDLINCYQSHR